VQWPSRQIYEYCGCREELNRAPTAAWWWILWPRSRRMRSAYGRFRMEFPEQYWIINRHFMRFWVTNKLIFKWFLHIIIIKILVRYFYVLMVVTTSYQSNPTSDTKFARVRGYVTNNNGFWSGDWIYCRCYYNYNHNSLIGVHYTHWSLLLTTAHQLVFNVYLLVVAW
jgi:hypothetical protein